MEELFIIDEKHEDKEFVRKWNLIPMEIKIALGADNCRVLIERLDSFDLKVISTDIETSKSSVELFVERWQTLKAQRVETDADYSKYAEAISNAFNNHSVQEVPYSQILRVPGVLYDSQLHDRDYQALLTVEKVLDSRSDLVRIAALILIKESAVNEILKVLYSLNKTSTSKALLIDSLFKEINTFGVIEFSYSCESLSYQLAEGLYGTKEGPLGKMIIEAALLFREYNMYSLDGVNLSIEKVKRQVYESLKFGSGRDLKYSLALLLHLGSIKSKPNQKLIDFGREEQLLYAYQQAYGNKFDFAKVANFDGVKSHQIAYLTEDQIDALLTMVKRTELYMDSRSGVITGVRLLEDGDKVKIINKDGQIVATFKSKVSFLHSVNDGVTVFLDSNGNVVNLNARKEILHADTLPLGRSDMSVELRWEYFTDGRDFHTLNLEGLVVRDAMFDGKPFQILRIPAIEPKYRLEQEFIQIQFLEDGRREMIDRNKLITGIDYHRYLILPNQTLRLVFESFKAYGFFDRFAVHPGIILSKLPFWAKIIINGGVYQEWSKDDAKSEITLINTVNNTEIKINYTNLIDRIKNGVYSLAGRKMTRRVVGKPPKLRYFDAVDAIRYQIKTRGSIENFTHDDIRSLLRKMSNYGPFVDPRGRFLHFQSLIVTKSSIELSIKDIATGQIEKVEDINGFLKSFVDEVNTESKFLSLIEPSSYILSLRSNTRYGFARVEWEYVASDMKKHIIKNNYINRSINVDIKTSWKVLSLESSGMVKIRENNNRTYTVTPTEFLQRATSR